MYCTARPTLLLAANTHQEQISVLLNQIWVRRQIYPQMTLKKKSWISKKKVIKVTKWNKNLIFKIVTLQKCFRMVSKVEYGADIYKCSGWHQVRRRLRQLMYAAGLTFHLSITLKKMSVYFSAASLSADIFLPLAFRQRMSWCNWSCCSHPVETLEAH